MMFLIQYLKALDFLEGKNGPVRVHVEPRCSVNRTICLLNHRQRFSMNWEQFDIWSTDFYHNESREHDLDLSVGGSTQKEKVKPWLHRLDHPNAQLFRTVNASRFILESSTSPVSSLSIWLGFGHPVGISITNSNSVSVSPRLFCVISETDLEDYGKRLHSEDIEDLCDWIYGRAR